MTTISTAPTSTGIPKTDYREAERQQRRQIQAARDLLQPSEVRLHHVPRWLTRRIKAALGKSPLAYHFGPDEVRRAADVASTNRHGAYWLDHFGTTTVHGRPAFVSEPYLEVGMVEDARRFAKLLGLTFDIRPNSWWYPGQTTRLVFQEPKSKDDQQPVPASDVAADEREQAGVTAGADGAVDAGEGQPGAAEGMEGAGGLGSFRT